MAPNIPLTFLLNQYIYPNCVNNSVSYNMQKTTNQNPKKLKPLLALILFGNVAFYPSSKVWMFFIIKFNIILY